MNPTRFLAALVALALLGGLTPARAQDKVLVPGDPPLTQEVVDLYQQIWEWYCDLKLTPEQRLQYTQLFSNFWKKRDKVSNEKSLADYRAMEKEWRGFLDLKGADQERMRIKGRIQWIDVLRKSTNAPSRFLASVYDAAYKPGGTKNAILVPGDPPLTERLVNREIGAIEMVLDLVMSEKQRQEFRQLRIESWKDLDAADKQRHVKSYDETWDSLPTWTNYRRNNVRTGQQSKVLAAYAKGSSPTSRWLTDLYQSAYKPGSARNPVLVPGGPPLTQLDVDHYRDYLEIVLDLSVLGGFTAAQRQMLQDYLVQDWTKMNAAAKQSFLAEIQRWGEVAAKGGKKVGSWLKARQSQVLTDLHQAAAENPRSKWLLEIYENERQTVRRMTDQMLRDYRTQMSILRKIGEIGDSDGHFEYNPNTKKYDRWVPNH